MTRTVTFALLLPLVAAPPRARGDRAVTAVLWLGGAGGDAAAAEVDAALAGSTVVAPLADGEVKRLLIAGGPATRVRERLAAGRARFAALQDLPAADALLGEAEEIALGGMTVGAACPQLVEIARLRLRFAELVHDEARASHAAMLLAACQQPADPGDAAALARHAAPKPLPFPSLRVESDPPGAGVYLDLHRAGMTPLELTAARRPGTLLDVEAAGFRKVHRVLDDKGGALALALARDDGLAALVDRMRAGPEASEADCTELSRRVGAAQLLAMRAGREGMVDVRLFDGVRGVWVRPPAEVKAPPGTLDATALLAYVTPPGDAKPAAQRANSAAATVATAATAPRQEPVPAYKKWYTWVIGGVLIAGVVAYVVVEHVGDDQITIHVAR